jgi:LysM repeat protein
MYQRLSSPYLPDHDYSDYLVSQYQDILDVCNYTNNIPQLVIQAQPNYATAVPPAINLTSVADTACIGQTILKNTLSPNANCASIAQAFNVPTGDVQFATGNSSCIFQQESICLPYPCTLQQVPIGATCDSLAASYSTSNLTVLTVQFLTWNPNINGLCDNLTVNDYICAGAPGGLYIPPPPPPGSANATGQARGGNDGSDIGAGTGTSPSGVGSNAPSPTQSGIVTGCTKYDQPKAGDGCFQFAQSHSITPAQLYAWNTILGPNGANCANEFFLGYYYCIAGPPSTSTTTTPASTSTPAPSPTQSGIATNCNKYAMAQSGEYCSLFAQEHGISTDNLYKWNTVLGANGANCDTQFFAGYEYCIGVSS